VVNDGLFCRRTFTKKVNPSLAHHDEQL
jgi:hypothetical protein